MGGFALGLVLLVAFLAWAGFQLIFGGILVVGLIALIYQPFRLVRLIEDNALQKMVAGALALLVWAVLAQLMGGGPAEWLGAAAVAAIDLALFWLMS